MSALGKRFRFPFLSKRSLSIPWLEEKCRCKRRRSARESVSAHSELGHIGRIEPCGEFFLTMSETPTSAVPDHEMVHRKIVGRIVADLRPVRRIWPLALRLAAWATVEIAVLLFVLGNSRRSDITQQMRNPWYLLSVEGFLLPGVLGATLALRAAVPGSEPRAFETGLLILIVSASSLLLMHQPFNGNILIATFLSTGISCVVKTFMLAGIPWAALLWAVRRGAPLSAGLGGALIGAAAFLSSFALMRLNCPIDEGSHILVWHLLPSLLGIALSAWLGTLLLKRRRGGERTRER